MPAGRYDITAEQGATFKLFLEYQDSTGTAESLSGFTSRMDVKKYIGDSEHLLQITGSPSGGGITGGGSTGFFSSGAGFAVAGGKASQRSMPTLKAQPQRTAPSLPQPPASPSASKNNLVKSRESNAYSRKTLYQRSMD